MIIISGPVLFAQNLSKPTIKTNRGNIINLNPRHFPKEWTEPEPENNNRILPEVWADDFGHEKHIGKFKPLKPIFINTKNNKNQKPEKSETKVDPKLLKKITELSKQLGHKSYKVRKSATKELKTIGKTIAAKQQQSPEKNIIVLRMRKLINHKDPEIKERAKEIINEIIPKSSKADNDSNEDDDLGDLLDF